MTPPVDAVALFRRHARLCGRAGAPRPTPVAPTRTFDDYAFVLEVYDTGGALCADVAYPQSSVLEGVGARSAVLETGRMLDRALDVRDGAGRGSCSTSLQHVLDGRLRVFEKLSETPGCRNNGSVKVSADVRRMVPR